MSEPLNTAEGNISQLTRRQLLLGMGGLGLAAMFPKAALAYVPQATRFIALDNTHTGEKLRITYWADGKYIQSALSEINRVLRDHRNNEVHEIDAKLIDKIALIHGQMDSNNPYEVISGYRSPSSNAAMHEKSKGVAKKSMHMTGQAIDLRLPGRSLTSLRDAALALNDGGVGYYASSQFVHVDTGKTRRW